MSIEAEEISVQEGELIRIEGDFSPRIQTALYQMRQPVLHELRLYNDGKEILEDVRLIVELDPKVGEEKRIQIAALHPGGPYVLDSSRLRIDLSAERLVNQTERERGSLRIWAEHQERRVGRFSEEIEILAYNEWPGYGAPMETIAAFVTPNHPGIARFLDLARQVMETKGEKARFEGYQSGEAQRVVEIAASIYSAVKRAGVDYSNPPASFQETGQKVRTAEQILESRLATCLDLSVFLAGALEQAGLHPFIVFVRGHAFPGLWLSDWYMPELYVDEPTYLLKRIRLGECLVFDSSAAAEGVPFLEACKVANAYLEAEGQFGCAVDIKAARAAGIRPLNLLREGAYRVAEIVDDGDSSAKGLASGAEVLPANLGGELPGVVEVEESRLDQWKRRLLDLSLRNRLLNHRDTRVVLPLLGQGLGELEDALYGRGVMELRPREKSYFDMVEEDRANLGKAQARQGRVIIDLGAPAFEKRALEIFRRNRQVEQESGTSALFLAMGMLTWFESAESSTPRKAPVILIPITIERVAAGGKYRILRTEQEPLINVTLVEKLQQDFGIELPLYRELPQDEAGIDIDGILRSVLHAIRDVERFDLSWDGAIAIYEFQKFMMWVDLEANQEKLMTNPVVRHIMEESEEPFAQASSFPRAEEIDRIRKADEDLSVVSADSSQLAAVFAALEGNSFVLQGPPGTGKSQTITNMIAQLLWRGKTVLFVSEKKAALEVVHSRLEQVGLGPFTLEVHSDRASLKGIIEQFEEPLRYQWPEPTDDWEEHGRHLQEKRERLNRYVEAIHRSGPFGESVYQSLLKLMEYRQVPQVGLRFSKIVDEEENRRLLQLLTAFVRAAERIGSPGGHAFLGAKIREWTPSVQREVEELAGEAERLGEAYKAAILGLVETVQVADEGLVGESLERWGALLSHLAGLPTPTRELLVEPRSHLEAMTMGAVAYLEKRGAAQQKVEEVFLPALYQEPELGQVYAQLKKWSGAFFLLAFFALFFVRRGLKKYSRQGLPPNSRLEEVVGQAVEVRDLDIEIGSELDEFKRIFGHHWQGERTQAEKLKEVLSGSLSFRQALVRLRESLPEVDEEKIWELALNREERWAEGTKAAEGAGRLLAAKNAWEGCHPQLRQVLGFEDSNWEALSLSAQIEKIRGWRESAKELRDWAEWSRWAQEAEEAGLSVLVEALGEERIENQEVIPAFERALRSQWVEEALFKDEQLAQFRGFHHDELIESFRRLDEESHQLARREIQAQLAARLPDRYAPGEMEVLRREFKKKRAYKPLRRLFQEAPEVLRRLKPCMMMSPLSVARYLDPAMRHFDVVIFDEASQIPPWDAIGAIARAEQAIIVGDSRQLPPTNFFSVRVEDDFDEGDIVEFESILDQAVVSGIPELTLDWHYRSRHESLIAFSNHHYYQNRLHIFPSPYHATTQLGVKWVEVPDGFYDRGGTRANQGEAKRVCEEVVRRLRDPKLSKKSIGVVTFSMAQQRCIEDLMEIAIRKYPEIQRFFGDGPDSVFIKNLENVQGDERDVMLFSIGYGPDRRGKVTMSFGPLNRDGGERRLNVAVTRARELLVVFSTLRADQIDLSRTQAQGVHHLKSFLSFAEHGDPAFFEAMDRLGKPDSSSSLEEEVAAALRDAGWTVHHRIGVAGYRVDLAIADPRVEGAYLLGVEFDGPSYFSAKNARDRDRIRRSVLESLGWELHRIWSTEWWYNQERELESLLAKLDELNQAPRKLGVQKVGSGPGASTLPELVEEEEEEQKISWPEWAEPWRGVEVQSVRSVFEDFYGGDAQIRGDLKNQVDILVKKYGPLSFESFARALAEDWEIRRLTEKVRRRVEEIIEAMPSVELRGDEVWPKELASSQWPGFRYSDESSPERELHEIVNSEIENVLFWVVERGLSIERVEAMREAARVFGFRQLGTRIREVFEEAVERLIEDGRLIEEEGRLRPEK